MSRRWNEVLQELTAIVAEIPPEHVPAAIAMLSSTTGTLAVRAMRMSNGPSTELDDRRLGVADLAAHLGIGESTLRRLIDEGAFKEGEHYARVGRRILFSLRAVEQHLRSQPPQKVNRPAAGAIPFIRKERTSASGK